MGSGNKGSFDLKPDLQQWALLAVWESESDFDRFYGNSFISKWWRLFTGEQWTLLCTPLSGRGSWDRKQPFEKDNVNLEYEGPVAVLTRATIRPGRLRNFWSNVSRVATIMSRADGFITSFGIGEIPFIKQATFSLWRSEAEMKAFAYSSADHLEVIRKTRNEQWYSEELFFRFKPVRSIGSLRGIDPFKDHFLTSEFKNK